MNKYPGFCQSCSRPLDRSDLHGTENDGSLSADYCKYCYADGHFTVPAMSLAAMKSHIIGLMNADGLPTDIVESAVSRLPFLKRWRHQPVNKNPELQAKPAILSPEEKHPLEIPPPAGPLFLTEEDADKIPDEETEMNAPYEPPVAGEAP